MQQMLLIRRKNTPPCPPELNVISETNVYNSVIAAGEGNAILEESNDPLGLGRINNSIIASGANNKISTTPLNRSIENSPLQGGEYKATYTVVRSSPRGC